MDAETQSVRDRMKEIIAEQGRLLALTGPLTQGENIGMTEAEWSSRLGVLETDFALLRARVGL